MVSLVTDRGCAFPVYVLSGAPNPFTSSGAPNPHPIFELRLGRINDVLNCIGHDRTIHTYRRRGCGVGIDEDSRIDRSKRREDHKETKWITRYETSFQSCSRNCRGCDGTHCMGYIQEPRVQAHDWISPTPGISRSTKISYGTQQIGRFYDRMVSAMRTGTFHRC